MTSDAATRRSVLVVRNPRARRAPSERELARAIAPLRAAGWDVELRTTSAPREATELAAGAARTAIDIVVACGGDGTVHEVANGLAGSDTALAVAPAGTADVWAREALIARNPSAALAQLPRARRVRVDLGVVNGRRFLLMCGIGLDAEVVRRVEARPRAKRRFGRLAYAAAGAAAALGARPVRTELTIDGETIHRELLLAIAGNTRLYGGVLRVTGAALADDGRLDLCLFHGDGVIHGAALAVHALRGGLDRRHRAGIDYLRGARVTVTPERALPVQADGELAGETPVTLSVEPRSLSVLVAPRPNPLFGGSPAEA